jgi:hypothetical protein
LFNYGYHSVVICIDYAMGSLVEIIF